MSVRRAAIVALVLGCARERVDVRPEPAPSASIVASASAGPSNEAATAPRPAMRCTNGVFNAGGWGDGLGLNVVGGYGGLGMTGGAVPAPATASNRSFGAFVGGGASATKDFAEDETDSAMCPRLGAARACIESGLGRARPALKGDLELELAITGGAPQTVTAVAGSLTDPARKCVVDAVRAAKFPNRTGTARYSIAVDAWWVPGVRLIELEPTIAGRLPPEVIKRIVRANFPRFRACFEQGLKADATLAGVVAVKFVIDDTGAVESANLDAKLSTLPSKQVQSCVLGVYRTLSFPEPDPGRVTVTFAIEFKKDS